jgi:hypothetical protein
MEFLIISSDDERSGLSGRPGKVMPVAVLQEVAGEI